MDPVSSVPSNDRGDANLMHAAATGRRIDGFDGIRGLATLMVVFYHLTVDFFPRPGFVPLPPDWTLKGAYVAVDLFFVLSGYLVTTLAFRDQDSAGGGFPVRQFYWRRAVRVFPALAFFAFGHVVYALLAGLSKRGEVASLSLAFGGLINYAWLFPHVTLNDGVVHLWTLSIELQFYLALPLIVVLLSHRRPTRSFLILMAAMVGVAAWRNHLWSEGVLGPYLLTRTDTHADSVLAGVALAYLWPLIKHLPTRLFSTVGWVGLLGWSFIALRFGLSDPATYKLGFTVAAVLSTWMLMAILSDTGPACIFRFRPFVAVGKVSYGFYIWHVMVFRGFVRWGGDLPTALQVTGAVLVTAAFTAVSWNLIEKPAIRYFRKRHHVTNSTLTTARA